MQRFYGWLYDRFMASGRAGEEPLDITPQAHRSQRQSIGIHLLALTLNRTGDVLADAKLILPWLLGAVGAPLFLVAWLVPVRESLALLPQLILAQWIRRFPRRGGLWSAGCLVQGLSALGMGLVPLSPWSGATAGNLVLGLLALFSLARCLCSIVIKDTMGKTIDRRRRGQVSGFATSLGGLVGMALALSLMLGWLSDTSRMALGLVLLLAGFAWLLAALVYRSLPEWPDAAPASRGANAALKDYGKLIRDPHFQRFLLTRGLFLSTALVAPFYVVLARQQGGSDLAGLGTLLLMAALANLISGNIWGRLADHSSRRVLVMAGILCGLLAFCVILGQLRHWPIVSSNWWYGLVIFVLYLAHAGVRLGRATYLVDMARAHNRAQLVALGNTIIGLVLLLAGAALSLAGPQAILWLIAILGSLSWLAALSAWALPEVTAV